MNTTVKLIYFYAKNFTGFHNGMGVKELELDLDKISDRNIFLILGDNGYGKSTLSSIIHPLPGTTDRRDGFIREGKEGVKKLRYRRMDGVEIECKIVYSPSKTGHTSKAFITKYLTDDSTIELNPNGNISSYKDMVFEELNVSDAILKISSQNDTMKGHVDMTSTERKNNMSEFLPEDYCSSYYSIIDKQYKELKSRLSIVVDNIGKLDNMETIEECLDKITSSINVLVDKRDKAVGKIKSLETRIDILVNDNNIEKMYNKTSKELDCIASKLNMLQTEISSYSESIPVKNKSVDNLTELKVQYTNAYNESDKLKAILENTLNMYKSRRNTISDDIEEKKSILAEVSSDSTIEELESIYRGYKARYDSLFAMMQKVSDKLSKEDLITGYDIIQVIRNNLYNIYDNKSENLDKAIDDMIAGFNSESELNELKRKKEKIEYISLNISNKLRELNSNNHLKEILDKRPSECTIDECPFIVNARKWTTIEKEIEKYEEMAGTSDNEIIKLNSQIEDLEVVVNICRNINMLIQYIEMNISLIKKLPYNDKYSSREKILKVIKKLDILPGVDSFDPFIEILELKEEFLELQYKKIPSIENEIKIMTMQGKLIESSRNELKSLLTEEERIYDDIITTKEKITLLNEKQSEYEDMIKSIDRLISDISDYNDIYNKQIELNTQYDKILSEMKDLDSYRVKLREKKIKLREIDDDLRPLTQKRDYYRMEQIKLSDYKRELKTLEEDMCIVEYIKESLSTKSGIPIDALDFFMDDIRQTANLLLSNSFNGEMYLDIFDINEKDFKMPFKHRGDIASDVSKASSSERSFVSLCLTLAIMDKIVSGYGIVILDEIDRGFSADNKYKFVKILTNYIQKVGISQAFLTTHSKEYYESYDVGFILFPGHGLKKYDDKDVIKVY